MSAQNAKKKRMGSRRKAVNQMAEENESPSANTSSAQSSTLGKTTEVTEKVNNQYGLTAVSPNWPSPEFKDSKRKFGSCRKQELRVRDIETTLQNKEDVEEANDGSETKTMQVLMEIQTQKVQELSEEFEHETLVTAGPNAHCEFKDSSGRKYFRRTDEVFSENLPEDTDETYSIQSDEIWISSPDKSGLSLTETLTKNVQPFVISVDSDLTREANDIEMPKELSENECVGERNNAELLGQMESFHHFQGASPTVDGSWPLKNADLTCSGKQRVPSLPNKGSLEDEGQNKDVDLRVKDTLISVEAVDKIEVQLSNSNGNPEIMHSVKSVTQDVTARATADAEIVFQSEFSADLSATKQDDLSPADQKALHKTIETFSVEKVDKLPSELNVTHCQDEDIKTSAKGEVLSDIKKNNSSPEAEQNLLLPITDYNDRFTENSTAKTSYHKLIATTAISSEIETEMQNDLMEPILRDMDSTLAENGSGRAKKSVLTVIQENVPEHFSTDLAMNRMQIDQSHFTEILEGSIIDVSVIKEEEVNCECKEDGNPNVGKAFGAFHQTSEEYHFNNTKNTKGGVDRADNEPGRVYRTEAHLDNETKLQALDSDVQANLDLPSTQLQQIDSVSNPVGIRRKLGSSRKQKLKPHAQDTDSSQQSAKEATEHNADNEPLEVALSLASETEVGDHVEEFVHAVTHGDPPELDSSDLLSSPTSNQQFAEVREGLLSMFSATEGKEQVEDSNLSGQDQKNLQLLASEPWMKSTNKEASTALLITDNPEKQSDIKRSSDPSTLSEEGKDHVNLPEGRGFLCSVDSSGKVDEEIDTPTVDNSLVLQSDSSLQSLSVFDKENMDLTSAENPTDQAKDSMQTCILDDASEYFSADLTIGEMQMDQSHFTDILEEFISVHSGTETHGNKDGELLSNDHSARASTPKSVSVRVTPKIYSSEDLAVIEYGTDNTIVALTKENFPFVDSKSEYQLEKGNVCDVLPKVNCIEADSKECRPNSENHQDHSGRESDFQGQVSAGASLNDWEKSSSHTQDLSSSQHSENSPINFDEEAIKASHVHDVSCSIKKEINDTCMSNLGSKTSTDAAVNREEELNSENKQEGNQTEGKDFTTFPKSSEVIRRKLGSSRKKKLQPHAQDTDSSQQSAKEATRHNTDNQPLEATLSFASETEVGDQIKDFVHGVTHGDTLKLDASDLLSSPTSNQQSTEVRQGLLGLFSATEGKEQEEEDCNSSGQDQNLQLLASEPWMKSTNKETSTALLITDNPEKQSDIKFSSNPSTLSEEGKDHMNLPEGRGFLCSVDSSGKVDEEIDTTTVDNSLVLQSDSSLQSGVVDRERVDDVAEEEIPSSENTVTDMEIEESSNARNGERSNTRYESVKTDSIQAVDVDSHPTFENSLGQKIKIDQALEEFARQVGTSKDMQGSGSIGIVENTEDLTEKKSEQEKKEELDPFSVQENSREEPTGEVPEEDQPSTTPGTSSIQEIHMDNHGNLETQNKQKRRKMGSTRRAHFNREQEEEMHNDNETKSTRAEPNDFEKVGADERLSSVIAEVVHSGNSEALANHKNTSVSDNSEQSNTDTNVSAAVVKGEESDVILVKAEDINNSERYSDTLMEELQSDDLIGTETSLTLNLGHATNVDWRFECVDSLTQCTQGNEDRVQSVQSDKLLESAAKLIVTANLEKVKSELSGGDTENPNSVSREVEVGKNLEVSGVSLSLKSEAKRRKMGSTRKSLASQREVGDLSVKQGKNHEITETAENGRGIITGALDTEDNKLTQQKDIVVEIVEPSCATEAYSRLGSTAEESQRPCSLTAHTVSTTSQPVSMSEAAAAGRRRKLGSHRKSHGYQRNRDKILGQGGTGNSHTEASKSAFISDAATKRTEEESQSLDKISEQDESDRKTPPNTPTANAAEEPEPLHGKTSTQQTTAQHLSTKRPGSPGSQRTPSIAEQSSMEALPSKSYNVILIGDSSVGKTSFMKRVQTGKFSLDLPASVGTDSCLSSVLVDGKRVVLQLWDTAGQERFHSITRQIFHRAQAFLLMYDITSSQSFSDVSYWANCIQESATDDVTILMLGNKSDSATRKVKSQDGEVLAKEYNFQFMECSAATGHNVTQSLEAVARVLIEKCDTREEAMLLRQEPQKKKSSGCC